jgi:hypothetical protein
MWGKAPFECPQCGAEELAGENSCGECDHYLTLLLKPAANDLSFDEEIAKIQRYLPNALITGNKRHFPKKACKGQRVVSPAEFLRELPRIAL